MEEFQADPHILGLSELRRIRPITHLQSQQGIAELVFANLNGEAGLAGRSDFTRQSSRAVDARTAMRLVLSTGATRMTSRLRPSWSFVGPATTSVSSRSASPVIRESFRPGLRFSDRGRPRGSPDVIIGFCLLNRAGKKLRRFKQLPAQPAFLMAASRAGAFFAITPMVSSS